ncbi:hypothetical protein C8J57DRAFT_1334886 [Mycena rebaudengoi]|nr:hypothetical protein C8J57DRAFT_1334886 [Mycena rebaudengoi]
MATHHIVAALLPSWGHTISYLHTAKQLLSLDPGLGITIVQHNLVVPKIMTELAGSLHDKARLRVIGVGETHIEFGPTLLKVAIEQLVRGWMETIAQLAQAKEWPRPQSIHFDFAFGGLVVEATKKIMGPDCKTLLWWSSLLVSMPAHLNDHDFVAIAEEIYADETRRAGRSLDTILDQVIAAHNGKDKLSGLVIKYPGGPDMYDHERHPYAAGPPLSVILTQAQMLAKVVDGYIATTSLCLEPVGIPYCREFYKKRGQELFTIGMQAHELCWTDAPTIAPSNERIKSFLDDAVSQHGPKSVLYISFGSFFFPIETPQLVEALVDTLLNLEQPFPFIFALGGTMASLPPDLIQRVHEGGIGLVCDHWVEQRALLQHGGVGWFLTHGGFNSVSESLTQGIPLIIWPVAAEQSVNAAFLSAEPNAVAIELFQVRTGPQLGPSLHSDAEITGTVLDASEEFKATFDAARGTRGAILQANTAKVAEAVREARAGEAEAELIRLTKY